jgi:hypothetical protein
LFVCCCCSSWRNIIIPPPRDSLFHMWYDVHLMSKTRVRIHASSLVLIFVW